MCACSGSGKYAEVYEGTVRLAAEAGAAAIPCAIKRLRASKGLQAERLLQEALTLVQCQDSSKQPLLLAVVLGEGHYYLVRQPATAGLGADTAAGECRGAPFLSTPSIHPSSLVDQVMPIHCLPSSMLRCSSASAAR